METIKGSGGLPKVALAAADGARLEAYLHGAHVTSWIPAGESADRLFLSPLARFAPGTAIRGGVPVCFPQFADQGPLPMHGFARDVAWELVAAGRNAEGAVQARFRLADSADTRKIWPHAFACELCATARGNALAVELAISNHGETSFAFTCALHTYLRVADVRETRVRGLAGAHYRDKVLRNDDVVADAPEILVDRPLDRVYRARPPAIDVVEAHRSLRVHASGTTDTVIWNPGPASNATPGDLESDAWRSFVCVEAAVASAPITLSPGDTWRGAQTLTSR
jgi:glucose-6-phosphate 1-epimerase